MAKLSKRSKTARAFRSMQDLQKTADMLLKLREKNKPSNAWGHKELLKHAKALTFLRAFGPFLEALRVELTHAGFVVPDKKIPAGGHDLTDKEVEEVTALRYRGLHGKPLYTMSEIVEQYGISKEAVEAIDYDTPM